MAGDMQGCQLLGTQNACDPIKPIIKFKHKIERQERPFRMCHMQNAWEELVALPVVYFILN